MSNKNTHSHKHRTHDRAETGRSEAEILRDFLGYTDEQAEELVGKVEVARQETKDNENARRARKESDARSTNR